MQRWTGVGCVLAALAFALLFGGSAIEACLGPIGVTPVECAANTGRLPHGTIAQPLAALGLVASLGLVFGVRRAELLPAALGLLAGLAAGVALYLGTRPDVLSGYTSRGTFLSLPVPPDPNVAGMYGILASGAAALFIVLAVRLRSTRRST